MERTDLSDRRFDVLLERLDRIADELAELNRRAKNDETLIRLTREVANLNESLQAIAYAALGQQAPHALHEGVELWSRSVSNFGCEGASGLPHEAGDLLSAGQKRLASTTKQFG